MADTNASLDFSIAYVKNPDVLVSQKPNGWMAPSEQPENPFVGKKDVFAGNASQKLAALLDRAEAKVLSKVVPVSEEPDKVYPSYVSKIVGVASRLDAQLEDEKIRIGKRPEKLGWGYERSGSDGEYVSSEVGVTDERVRSPEIVPMDVSEKAEKVFSVQAFNGEMDVAGGRSHFRPVHWLFGEEVEIRAEKQVVISRPVMPLQAPVRKSADKFPIAEVEKYDEEFVPVGKLLRMPIFVEFDVDKAKIMLNGNRRNEKKGIKVANEFGVIRAVLSSEPMPVKVIAEKVGMTGLKVSKILKNAISVGSEIKMVVVKDEKGRGRPAFFL